VLDEDYLYERHELRCRAHEAITTGLARDFDSGNSDVFGLTIDTFHDRRNSFLFLVNPKGAVRDEQTYNDSRTVVDAWEGIIDVRTAVVDSGWVVEMRIHAHVAFDDAGQSRPGASTCCDACGAPTSPRIGPRSIGSTGSTGCPRPGR
jgi:hypothetical protein